MSNRLDTWSGHLLMLIAVVAVTLVGYYKADAQVQVLATETHSALCTFKNSLQQRYDSGVDFLENNPDGIPGISAADIERSLVNQKATLDALSELDCRQEVTH